ncbi:sodium:calcium antiporter [Aquibium sp. A9E412]|uniref:sodium:calcium antiporter n=1 Tax=Aquibium sp. A9E412 TaxID=2976767 RepID=UPI0025B03FE9|nr:sodium:calcium antiporter [Aquibium sp. A9E412]MDN2564970.1 sodium:calcium antiporter [Aquibium sp. A9E412]
MNDLSLGLSIGLFALAALVIAIAGVRMTGIADRIADQTRLGEAVVGGMLLGASTSLSGIVTSVSAARDGLASLAMSNAVGGIAAQTAFLVVADLTYRRVNLEHAAADSKNMLQASLLILLLGAALSAYLTPDVHVWSIHPATPVLFAIYLFGAYSTVELKRRPMWRPEKTADTRTDEPEEEPQKGALGPLAMQFTLLALVLGASGYVVAKTGARISAELGVSETVVGTLLTSTATSLPELVTTLAAVRQGALQLAVGGIIGGNTFDVLFLSVADIAYRDGSLFHAVAQRDALMLVAAIVMTAILLMGLILRDRRGIGFEGFAILGVYAGVLGLQVALG